MILPKSLTLLVGAVVYAVCLLYTLVIAGDSAQDIYARYADSVVTIRTFDDTLFPLELGSGIVIEPNQQNGSFILTNYHVIHRAGLIHVQTKAGATFGATICYFDEPSDTALLRTSFIKCSVPPTTATVQIGSEVFAIGTPRGLGWTISNGIISAIRKDKFHQLVQFTAAASAGSSGGPLFDGNGNLVGITSFKARAGENLNFAVRITAEGRTAFEKQFWRGQHPFDVSEAEWCLGHSEQGTEWMDHNEKAKSWRAYTTVIKDLEEKSLSRRSTAAEKRAEYNEWVDAVRNNRRPDTPGNILAERVDEAYGTRYEAFSDDRKGWDRALSGQSWRSSKVTNEMKRLTAAGLKNWPHWSEVLTHVVSNLDPDDAVQYLEATANSIPTKKEIEALQRSTGEPDESGIFPEMKPAGPLARAPLEQLVYEVWKEPEYIEVIYTHLPPQVHEQFQVVRQTIIEKGWRETVERIEKAEQQNSRPKANATPE